MRAPVAVRSARWAYAAPAVDSVGRVGAAALIERVLGDGQHETGPFGRRRGQSIGLAQQARQQWLHRIDIDLSLPGQGPGTGRDAFYLLEATSPKRARASSNCPAWRKA